MTILGLILVAMGLAGWFAGWRNVGGLTPPQGRLLMLAMGLGGVAALGLGWLSQLAL